MMEMTAIETASDKDIFEELERRNLVFLYAYINNKRDVKTSWSGSKMEIIGLNEVLAAAVREKLVGCFMPENER